MAPRLVIPSLCTEQGWQPAPVFLALFSLGAVGRVLEPFGGMGAEVPRVWVALLACPSPALSSSGGGSSSLKVLQP